MVHGSLQQKLRHLAESIPSDSSSRELCPACLGGSTGERSLSVTSSGGLLLYNCHRASCAFKGVYRAGAYVRASPAPTKVRRYSGEVAPLPEELVSGMFKKYSLSKRELQEQGIVLAVEINRIKFPIYDYRGYEIGENLRAITSGQKPKALINKFNEVPLLHFPLGQEFKDSIVLVEDQISSLKVSRSAYCASLLGTNLSPEGLSTLMRIGIKKVLLMMDGDPPGVAAAMKLRGIISPHIQVECIMIEQGKDPKDLTREEIERCVYSVM